MKIFKSQMKHFIQSYDVLVVEVEVVEVELEDELVENRMKVSKQCFIEREEH